MGEKLNPNENLGVIEGEFEEGSVSYVPPEVGDEPTKPESDTETPAGSKEPEVKKPEEKPAEKQDDHEPLPKGALKRINKLTKQKYDVLRDRDEIQKKYEAEKEQTEKLKQQLKEAESAKMLAEHMKAMPKKDSYQNDEEYMVELANWAAKKSAIESASKPVEPEAKPDAAKKPASDKKDEKVQEAIDKGLEVYDDFDQVVFSPELKMSEPMAHWIKDSEVAHDIFYYLGKHLDESAKIFEMGERQMIRALTKIELDFIGKEPDEKPEPVEESVVSNEKEEDQELAQSNQTSPNVTRAPDPIKPSGGKTVPRRSPDQMTNEEYRKYRGFSKDARRKIA